jgi:cell division protein FtsL
MNVKPEIRLILLLVIVLVQFFLIVSYSNTLAGKNVELTQIQTEISQENLSQGEYREVISQQLNEELVIEARNENIQRITPEQTIKLRDLQPAEENNTDPSAVPSSDDIIAF